MLSFNTSKPTFGLLGKQSSHETRKNVRPDVIVPELVIQANKTSYPHGKKNVRPDVVVRKLVIQANRTPDPRSEQIRRANKNMGY